MNEAEKKAAALPPKLTVPMILFFLPVLFVVILTPAIIQVRDGNLKTSAARALEPSARALGILSCGWRSRRWAGRRDRGDPPWWRLPRRREILLQHGFSVAELALRLRTSARLWRTRASAFGLSEACLSVRSASGRRFAQGVGQAEVGQDARLVRNQLQGRLVVFLRERMIAHLVGDRALRREDPPVGPLGSMGAVEHLRRLLVASDVRRGFCRRRPAVRRYRDCGSPPAAARRAPAASDRGRGAPGRSATPPSHRPGWPRSAGPRFRRAAPGFQGVPAAGRGSNP